MRAASYLTPEPNVTAAGGRRLGGLLEAAGAGRPSGPEVRRGDADVAPERLGELGRLAVPDAGRNLADRHRAGGQQLGGAGHPHPGQVLAERGAADLGEGPLELAARGGQAPGDVIQRELLGVLALDDMARLLVEARAESDRRKSLSCHLAPHYDGRRKTDVPARMWRICAHPP